MGRHQSRSPVGNLQILVNHLTRMQPGYFCVAGVDVNTPRHIRPVLRRGRLTLDLLSTGGGPFDVDPDDYWNALDGVAQENLAEIFGSALELWDESGTVDVGEGRASLGCLKPEKQPWLYVDHRGTVRMVLDYLMPSVD